MAPLVWFAPIPVLVMAQRAPAVRAAALAFLAYLLGGLNIVPFLARLAPQPVVAAALIVPALAFALSVLAHRRAVLRWPSWAAVAAFPAAWTSFEFLLSLVSPDGTALNLAYTQARMLPLVQVASLTGLWGVSFLVTLLPAGLAAAWLWRGRRPLAIATLCMSAGLFVAVWAGGWARLSGAASGATLRVAAAATDETVGRFDTTIREEALAVLEAYAARVSALARGGAQVVVLPEKLAGVTPAYEPEALAILRASARQNKVTVIAGLNLIGRTPARNTAFIFAQDGAPPAEYDKAFLLPAFESEYGRGTAPGLIEIQRVPAGVAICKDMDFPRWLRRYAAEGARVVFVPAWDFVVDGPLHARMAMLRGVEGGFAVVRAAQQGWVTISDPLGRVLTRRATSDLEPAMILGEVPVGSGRTFYSRAGDWFGVTNIGILAMVLWFATWRRPP